MASASGSRAHKLMSSPTASVSRSTSSAPRRRDSISWPSARVSTSRVSRCAHSVAARPASWRRLVTTTMHGELPGSSGRTCASSLALSRMISTWRPASRLRYRAACASGLAGMRSAGMPNASRKPLIASGGATGVPDGSKPRRSTYSCPSGKRSAARCAQCTASAVLPTPAVPLIDAICGVPAALSTESSSPSRAFSSSARPTKCRIAAGSCRGTTCRIPPAGPAPASPAPAGPVRRPVSAGVIAAGAAPSAGPRPPRSRPGRTSPSASQSRSTDRRCGRPIRPRSMSLMVRTPRPDRSASSSWVRPAATRRPRTSSPNRSRGSAGSE